MTTPAWYSYPVVREMHGLPPLPDCCAAHDGPHLHGCCRPRTEDGQPHPGPCPLPKA